MSKLLFLSQLIQLSLGLIISGGISSKHVLNHCQIFLELTENMGNGAMPWVLGKIPGEVRYILLDGNLFFSLDPPLMTGFLRQIQELFINLFDETFNVIFQLKSLVIAEHECVKVSHLKINFLKIHLSSFLGILFAKHILSDFFDSSLSGVQEVGCTDVVEGHLVI